MHVYLHFAAATGNSCGNFTVAPAIDFEDHKDLRTSVYYLSRMPQEFRTMLFIDLGMKWTTRKISILQYFNFKVLY